MENTTTPPPSETTDVTSDTVSEDQSAEPEVTTVSDADTTTAVEPEETTVVDPDETTVIDPEVTTVADPDSELPTTEPPAEPSSTTAAVTTTVLITIPEDDIPLDTIIIVDDDIPLGDLPINTGVDNNMTLFIIVGGAALTLGVGAQIYTVVLKKKH